LITQDQTCPVEINDVVPDGVAAAVVDIDAGAVAGQNIVADQRAGN
jgi:hypothetical protein